MKGRRHVLPSYHESFVKCFDIHGEINFSSGPDSKYGRKEERLDEKDEQYRSPKRKRRLYIHLYIYIYLYRKKTKEREKEKGE